MAFLVWMAAVRQEDPLETKNFPQKVSLRVVAPAPELVILDPETIPPDVQVKIRAPQSVWQTLTPGRIKASVDLSAYPAGLHSVPIQVEVLDRQATVQEVSPSEVSLQLEPLATKILPVTAEVLDSPPQGYFNRLPVSDPFSVTVKGSAAAVDVVERVVAEVRLNNSKETLKTVATLSPRTTNDELVLQVTLDPPRATITVPIDQRFGYKDVSV
ncbi:MAG: YbbR-like domain-containing protein, partial [Anaerolineae bacterium]